LNANDFFLKVFSENNLLFHLMFLKS